MINKLKQLDYRYYIGIIVIAIAIVFGLIFILRAPKSAEAEWFNDGWYYRKSIPVTNNTTTEMNVYVSVTIDTSDTTKFQTDCDDVRFTNSAGNRFPYYLVSGCGTDTTVIHVYFNNLDAGLQNIYYYYGNSSVEQGSVGSNFSTVASDYTIGTITSEEQSEVPIAYWSFDEGYGTIAHDNTSSKNHGTLTNMTTTGISTAWVDGKFGKGLKFGDHNYDNLALEEEIGFSDGDEHTLSFWIKNDGTNTYITVAGKETENGNSIYIIDNSVNYIFYFRSATQKQLVSGVDTTVLFDKNWHQVVMTVNSSKLCSVYFDGKLQGSATLTTSDMIYSSIGSGINAFQVDGIMDEVKIYNYVLSASQVKKSYSSRSKNFTAMNLSKSKKDAQNKRNVGLVGFWKMDEDSWDSTANEVIDYSGLGNHGTSYADATTTSSARYNRAGEFDGTGDYISCGSDSSLDMGDGSLTIGTWIKADNVDNYMGIINKSALGGSLGWGMGITNGKVRCEIHDGSRAWTEYDTTIEIDTWYYIMAVFDRGDDKIKVYINGNKESTELDITGKGSITGSNCYIGSLNTSAWIFDGQVDHVKVWKRALTTKEISEEYVTGPAPVAYWSMDQIDGTTVVDQSGMGNDCTMDGGVTKNNNWKPGKVGQALSFKDDADAHLDCGNDSSLDITGAITIESWVKPDSYDFAYPMFLSKAGSYYRTGLAAAGDGRVFFRVRVGGAYKTAYSSSDVPLNEWTHVIGTYDGEYMRVYVNGILNGTPLALSGNIETNVASLIVGSASFDGDLDEIKLYNYALTPYQIAQAYGNGAPLTYWSFDEGQGTTAYDSLGSKNHGTLTNMTTTGVSSAWVDGKFGKGLRFDGSDDYIDAGDFLDNGETTVSLWFRSSYQGTHNGLIDFAGSSGIGHFDFNHSGDDRPILYLDSTNFRYFDASATDYMDGEWHYLVLYIPGSDMDDVSSATLSIDNVNIPSSSTSAAGTQDTWNDLYIGKTNYGSFNGDLDEVKIYNYQLTPFDIEKEFVSSRGKKQTGLNLSKSEQDNESAQVEGLVAHWKMDEASWDGTADEVIDYSGLGNHGVSADDAHTTTTARYNRAGGFDGTDDRITIANDDSLNPSSAITISAWFYANSFDGDSISGNCILSKGASTNGYWLVVGSGKAHFKWGSYLTNDLDSDTFNPTTGEWHHILISYDGNHGIFYYDGNEVGEGDMTKGDNNTSSMSLGYYISPVPNHFDGALDNVKIWNRALSPTEAVNEYHKILSPVGYWSMDNIDGITVTDDSGMGNDCTMDGELNKADDWKPGKVGQSLFFENCYNGGQCEGHHLECGNDSSLDIEGAITVEQWVKPNSFTYYPIFMRKPSDLYRIGLRGTNPTENLGDGRVYWRIKIGGVAKAKSGAIYIPSNEWSHVVGTYDGEYMRLYINGVLDGAPYAVTGDIDVSTYDLIVGAYNLSGNYTFDGDMDEVKLYNYALTSHQVAQAYNNGKPIAHWTFNEGEGDVVKNKINNTYHGDIVNATYVSGKSDTALNFDGDGDYIDFDNTEDDTFYPTTTYESVTIATWMKLNTASQESAVVGRFDSVGSNHWYNYGSGIKYVNGAVKVMGMSNANNPLLSYDLTDTSSWHHVVAIVNTTDGKLYVDGILRDSGDLSSNGGYDFAIGAQTNAGTSFYFDGQLDEVKIWNYGLSPLDVQNDYNLGKGVFFK